MKPSDHQRMAMARTIVGQYEAPVPDPLDSLTSHMRNLSEIFVPLSSASYRLALCRDRRWAFARRQQIHQFALLAQELATSAAALLDAARTQASQPPSPVVGLAEVYRDLLQLQEEFDTVELDAVGKVLSITTSPITLGDLYLGPFDIRLTLEELPTCRRRSVYRVVAVDPHPASANESVTHPHVRDEELCEGEATSSIRAALESGRLCDFFMLVRSVLENYNPGSPYVALDDWEGSLCEDCGCTFPSDETHFCEGCQRDFCSDCIGYCQDCDNSRCNRCLKECPECGQSICRSCSQSCSRCDLTVCSNCLENDLCPACREEEEPHEPSTNEPANGRSAGEVTGGEDPPARVAATDTASADALSSSNGKQQTAQAA
ncbi:MAG TPA: hypothetical protein VHQ47_18325 [Phycisphaerae bacterium]|nr:hypothetical protein [Phycisphaerae bacterium]